MQVVERLNNSPHLEKIHYFMSKADAVEKEHDRQRVLIQITQNLATRIRNSHAFNLPTVGVAEKGESQGSAEDMLRLQQLGWIFMSFILEPKFPVGSCSLSVDPSHTPLGLVPSVLPTAGGWVRSRDPKRHRGCVPSD